jgi:hypothetical protein
MVGAIVASIGLLGNALLTSLSSHYQRGLTSTQHNQSLELERSKAEAERILEVIKTNDPDKSIQNLRFLLSAGLIKDNEINVRSFLESYKPGQEPVLPSPSGQVVADPARAFRVIREVAISEEILSKIFPSDLSSRGDRGRVPGGHGPDLHRPSAAPEPGLRRP